MHFILLALLFCFATEGQAARKDEGVEWQWYGLYSKDALRFSTDAGEANFSGTSVGGGLVQRIVTKRGNGFAVRGEFAMRKGDNTANALVAGTTESLKGTSFVFGARYYAFDTFLGLSGTFMPFTINYVSTTRTVERKYNGYGFGIELGIDLFLGDTIFICPKGEYQMFSAQPGTGATNAERVSGLNLGLELGLVF